MSERVYKRFACGALAFYVCAYTVFRCSELTVSLHELPWGKAVVLTELLLFAFALGVFAMRNSRPSRIRVLLLAVLGSLLLFSMHRTYDNALVLGLLVLLVVRRVPLERACRTFAFTSLAVVVIVVLLSLAGRVAMRDSIPNARLVFSYGFNHPNTLGAVFFGGVSALAGAEWRRAWSVPLVLSVVGCAFCYALLSSYATTALFALLTLVILIGHLPLGTVPLGDRVEKLPYSARVLLGIVVPLLLAAGMVVLTAAFDPDNPLMNALSRLTHERLFHAKRYYDYVGGFTMLGRVAVGNPNGGMGQGFWGVDSGYCYLALVFGLASCAAIAAAYIYTVQDALKRRFSFLVLAMLVMGALYLVVEDFPMYLYSSPCLLFLVCEPRMVQPRMESKSQAQGCYRLHQAIDGGTE